MAQSFTLSRQELWKRKLVYPGHTIPTALAPALIAVGLAVHDRVFALVPAMVAFLAGWMIQFAGVVIDNYENLVQQPEDREHPELVEALRLGLLTLSGLRTTALACYVVALLAGVYLAFSAGWPVVVIGLASIAASWAYSAGPFPFGRHGLADPLFFAFFGVVSVMGVYYVQAAPSLAHMGGAIDPAAFPFSAFALGLPVGAMITGILIIDDIRDREFDAVKGKNTIAVRWGVGWSRAEWLLLMTLAYLAPLWFRYALGYTSWIYLPLLSLPLAISLGRNLLTHERYADLLAATPRAARLVLIYSTLLAVALALA